MKIKEWISRNPYLLLLMPGVILYVFFFVIPFLWVVKVSFYQNIPGGYMRAAWVVENYKKFLGDFWYIRNVIFFSFKIAIGTSFFAVLFAYPLALYIVKSSGLKKRLLLIISLSPLLISLVCLVLGLMIILRGEGILNHFALWAGIISEPVKYMYTVKGVFICLIYVSIPYVVLSLLDNLSKINPCLEEAAMNVGANRWQSFLKITFPLSTPGMVAGSLVVFSLNLCAFAVPLMIGEDRIPMIGLFVYNQCMELSNIPFASAIAIIALGVCIITLFIYHELISKLFFKRLGV
jgi:putative spermidine/putrescine transport system permease protein